MRAANTDINSRAAGATAGLASVDLSDERL